jgi:hypothetical protein
LKSFNLGGQNSLKKSTIFFVKPGHFRGERESQLVISIITKTLLAIIRLRRNHAENVSTNIKKAKTHDWTSKTINLISKEMTALIAIYLMFERHLEN